VGWDALDSDARRLVVCGNVAIGARRATLWVDPAEGLPVVLLGVGVGGGRFVQEIGVVDDLHAALSRSAAVAALTGSAVSASSRHRAPFWLRRPTA
jgi:hypothetical protein